MVSAHAGRHAFDNLAWPTSAFCFGPPWTLMVGRIFRSSVLLERSPEGGAEGERSQASEVTFGFLPQCSAEALRF
jgi:hypothetical protein